MKEGKLVPKRRFKEFKSHGDWEQRKLGDVGSVAMNKRIFKDQTSEVGDVPFYKIGTFGDKPDAYIPRELFEKYKAKYPYPEVSDILISASGSIGRTVEYTGKDEYFQDSNIVWLKHDGRLNNSFLKQFYTVVKWEGLEGSTIKRLYNKNILETKILLPSLMEQQKIGTFFSNLDDLITLHHRKLKKFKELKSAYLSEMFPKEGEKYPKRRFPGFTEAWEQRRLGDVCIVKTGYAFNSNDFDDNGELLVITNGNIQNNSPYVDGSIGNKIDIKDNMILNEYVLNRNDILITMDGTVGRTAKVMEERQVLAQRVGRLIAKSEPEFLYQFLNTGEFFNKMSLISHGGTIKHISLTEISDYISSMPSSKEEQKKIGTFFEDLDKLITLHHRKLEKLENIKKAYLNEMFV